MVGNTDLFDIYASLRRAIAVEASDVLKKINLGSREFIILFSLHRHQRMTVGDLVVAAMTDKATVSRSLVQLINKNYVEKLQCAKDGRVFYVTLTAKGKKLAPQMQKLYDDLANRCFAVLKPAERDQLAGLLTRVVAGLEQPSYKERQAEV